MYNVATTYCTYITMISSSSSLYYIAPSSLLYYIAPLLLLYYIAPSCRIGTHEVDDGAVAEVHPEHAAQPLRLPPENITTIAIITIIIIIIIIIIIHNAAAKEVARTYQHMAYHSTPGPVRPGPARPGPARNITLLVRSDSGPARSNAAGAMHYIYCSNIKHCSSVQHYVVYLNKKT